MVLQQGMGRSSITITLAWLVLIMVVSSTLVLVSAVTSYNGTLVLLGNKNELERNIIHMNPNNGDYSPLSVTGYLDTARVVSRGYDTRTNMYYLNCNWDTNMTRFYGVNMGVKPAQAQTLFHWSAYALAIHYWNNSMVGIKTVGRGNEAWFVTEDVQQQKLNQIVQLPLIREVQKDSAAVDQVHNTFYCTVRINATDDWSLLVLNITTGAFKFVPISADLKTFNHATYSHELGCYVGVTSSRVVCMNDYGIVRGIMSMAGQSVQDGSLIAINEGSGVYGSIAFIFTNARVMIFDVTANQLFKYSLKPHEYIGASHLAYFPRLPYQTAAIDPPSSSPSIAIN